MAYHDNVVAGGVERSPGFVSDVDRVKADSAFQFEFWKGEGRIVPEYRWHGGNGALLAAFDLDLYAEDPPDPQLENDP